MDWSESSDPFGMVRISIHAGSNVIRNTLHLSDWIMENAKVKELAIGEIQITDSNTFVDIHSESAQRVLEIIERRDFEGQRLEANLATR